MSIGVQGIGFYILRPYPDTSISMLVHLQTQGPHSQSLMTGGGGPTEVHILYPKRSRQNLSIPKNHYFF